VNGRLPAAGEVLSPAGPADDQDFRHLALFYRGAAEYQAEVGGFIQAALVRGDAVFAALPLARAGPLREALGADARQVAFADMAEVGRNPGRIIPAIHAFVDRHRGKRVSYVGEPAWAGRSAAELVEAARHEALINLAFSGKPVTVLCPYDAAGLPPDVLADAERTHPELLDTDGARPSPAYLGPAGLPSSCSGPLLPPPPPGAEVLRYRNDLHPVRALVARQAALARLAPDRAADLVLAVSELAANTLSHTRDRGTLRSWHTASEILCEISDQGWISDPLAGRHRPRGDDLGGHGLWLVHQVCDLVETRTSRTGTTFRLHMRRKG
jgi:anti-sigma regulatory factor (Ser/Thr protein kinase)